MTVREIAEKYVYGKHSALTDQQEIEDMIKDIEKLSKISLRDQLAMSMNHSSIPTIEGAVSILEVAKLLNISVDVSDELSLIDFALHYEASIRYKYADAMIETRSK